MAPVAPKDFLDRPWWFILVLPAGLVLAVVALALGLCVLAPVALFRSWAGRKGPSPPKSPTEGQSAPVAGNKDEMVG